MANTSIIERPLIHDYPLLRLPEDKLQDKHALLAAYHHTLPPLMALARNMGY